MVGYDGLLYYSHTLNYTRLTHPTKLGHIPKVHQILISLGLTLGRVQVRQNSIKF